MDNWLFNVLLTFDLWYVLDDNMMQGKTLHEFVLQDKQHTH